MKMPSSPKTKAQAHLNQADTPTMESASVCIFSRVKIEHAGGTIHPGGWAGTRWGSDAGAKVPRAAFPLISVVCASNKSPFA